jgi:hypothetical protein
MHGQLENDLALSLLASLFIYTNCLLVRDGPVLAFQMFWRRLILASWLKLFIDMQVLIKPVQ